MEKEDSKDMDHMNDGPMNSQHPSQQHIIVSGSHQIPQQQVVIAQSSQNSVYQHDGQTYIYQPAQNQGDHPQQQRIIVQQVRLVQNLLFNQLALARVSTTNEQNLMLTQIHASK